MVNDTVMDFTFFRTAALPLITAITADKNRSVNSKWRPLTGLDIKLHISQLVGYT